MKEKALLFKDYIQPYNFASNDNNKLPDTSRESLFGSTAVSSGYPMGPASKSISDDPYTKSPAPVPVTKRNYEPPRAVEKPIAKPKNVRPIQAIPRGLTMTDGSSDSSPETIHREPAKNKRTYFNDGVSPINDNVPGSDVMPSNLTGPATSMEWDPFEPGKGRRGNKMIPRRRRNISPISEGDEEENVKPFTSLEAHAGSELPGSPEYSETSSYVDSAPSTYKIPSSASSEESATIRSDEYSTTSDDGTGSLPTTTETTTRTQTSDDTTGWIPPRREYDRRRSDRS